MSTEIVLCDRNDSAGALGAVLRAARAQLAEQRSSLENPSTPLSYPAEWLLDIFNGGRTDSGLRVSEMTALQVSTVFACVQLISGAMGFLDLQVTELEKAKDGRMNRRVAYDHDLYDILENEPNEEMTSFTFRKTLQCHALLWGNSYAEIQRDRHNGIVAIWPRNPSRTRAYRISQKMAVNGELVPAGGLVYKTSEGLETASFDPEAPPYGDGPERVILKEDMIHVPGLALDGRVGQSVIHLARQVVGLSLAAEKFGAKFFGNGAKAGGILKHPATLTPVARETLKRSWMEAQGGENAHRTAVLENGIDWQDISIKPNEGQFLETRQFQKSELCSIFLVPPHMIGDTEKTNRANVEQIGLEFVTFTLSPHIKAWEQELKRKLFPKAGRSAGKFYAHFDTRPLTMPDAQTRQTFYNSGKQWGWLSTNDIHHFEHLNPIDEPWADGYWIPINMQDAETAFGEPAQGPGPAGGDDPGAKDPAQKLGKRFVRAYLRLFNDAFGRVLARSTIDSDVCRRAFLPVLQTIGEGLRDLLAEQMNVEPEFDIGASKFFVDYVDGMLTRVAEWKQANGDAAAVAERELERAVRAITIEISRELATARAKILTEA